MSIPGLLQLVLYVVLLILITKPLGLFMWRVFDGERTFLTPVIGPLERVIYRLTGVHPEVEQGWKGYTFALLLFSVVGVADLCHRATAERAAVQSARARRRAGRIWRSTRPSASPPTPTGRTTAAKRR